MKKLFLVFLCAVLLSGVLPGCIGVAKKPQTPQQNPPQTKNLDVSASERRVMANQLSKAAEGIPNVQKATVVVVNMSSTTGNLIGANDTNPLVALVGLTVSQSVSSDANALDSLKKTVAEKLKASESRVSQVLVTTDPTMIKRIGDIAAGIIEGKPIQSYEKDVNTLTSELKKQKAAY